MAPQAMAVQQGQITAQESLQLVRRAMGHEEPHL